MVKEIFHDNLVSGKPPGFERCKDIVKNCHALGSRTPAQIKAWVNNQIKKKDPNSDRKGYYFTF